MNLKAISPLVITILISICSSAQPSAPCKRLLMSGLENSAIFPWIQLSGLYHLYDVPNATFPLYKHDLQDMFFYHNTTAKRFEIKPAEWILKGWQPVLGALTSGSYIATSPTTPFYPFRYMIDKWFQYNPAEGSYVTHSANTIQPMCVSDDVQTCFGGKIVFNQNLTQSVSGTQYPVFIIGKHYYQQIPGLYSSLRPVYQQMGEPVSSLPIYLFYLEEKWVIGSNYTNSDGMVYTKSEATRPEWVTSDWFLYSNTRWTKVVGLSMQCRAWSNDTCDTNSTAVESQQCQNGGRCTSLRTSRTSLCQCPDGFAGTFCEQATPQCPDYNSNLEYAEVSSIEGSILTVWCPKNHVPQYWQAVCQSSGSRQPPYWNKIGMCVQLTTTTTTTTTTTLNYKDYYRETRRKKNKFRDADAWLIPVVMLLSILGTLFDPLIPYYISKWLHQWKLVRIASLDEEEDNRVATAFQERTTEFSQRHPGSEEEYDSATKLELECIRKEYMKELEEIAEKRKKRGKGTGKMKLFRMYSLCSYISWIIWIIVMAVLDYFWLAPLASVFGILGTLSLVFVIVLPLVTLVESFCSPEREYLNNLSSLQSSTIRIESIRTSQPFVGMKAVCYHYETRTRYVSYTDSSGNWQTRMETYQEMVISNTYMEAFHYRFWKDSSETKLNDVRRQGVTKIKMDLHVIFGDTETSGAYYQQYSRFSEEHEHKDDHIMVTPVYDVAGFEERLCAFTDLNSKPWWIGSLWYWIATLLTLTWPYRFLFNSVTGRTEYNVVKTIFLRTPPSEGSGFQEYVDQTGDGIGDGSNYVESHDLPPSYDSATGSNPDGGSNQGRQADDTTDPFSSATQSTDHMVVNLSEDHRINVTY